MRFIAEKEEIVNTELILLTSFRIIEISIFGSLILGSGSMVSAETLNSSPKEVIAVFDPETTPRYKHSVNSTMEI